MGLDQTRSFPKRPRLAAESYIGYQRYSLTLATHARLPVFENVDVVHVVSDTLKQVAIEQRFRIWVFCFMPDHLHLLIEGKDESVDMQKFVKLFKQKSGFRYKQIFINRLWGTSYFDHVLRKEEDTEVVIRYILDNPVRANLVHDWFEYPYSGSFELGLKDLIQT